MLKFMVVVSRRADWTHEEFRRHFEKVHGPLAKQLPGLRKYVQNYVCSDPKRESPGWDAIVELYFDNWGAMEAAWASSQGAASDADLEEFADMARTTWSVVEEVTVMG